MQREDLPFEQNAVKILLQEARHGQGRCSPPVAKYYSKGPSLGKMNPDMGEVLPGERLAQAAITGIGEYGSSRRSGS